MHVSWLIFTVSLSCPAAKCQRYTDPQPADDNETNIHFSFNEFQNDSVSLHTDEIVWDPDRETAQRLQGRLCPERCNGTEKVNEVVGTMCPQCFPCVCHEHCRNYGTCCPPLGQDSWTLPHTDKADCFESALTWTFRVVACDPSYPDNGTRTLCESESRPRRLDTVLPVTAMDTGVTYANIHCALCSGDFSPKVTWEMSCRHNQYLYDVTNDTQYDLHALLLPQICSPALTSFPLGEEHLCFSSLSHYKLPADLVSTCNVTGRWEKEEAHVRRACEESDWSRADVVIVEKRRVYANVFCGMCNEAQGTFVSNCSLFYRQGQGLYEGIIENIVTNTELISFRSPVQKVSVNLRRTNDCPDHYWKHPKIYQLDNQPNRAAIVFHLQYNYNVISLRNTFLI